jgi:uncharacterized protein YutE (UPF0331/DUF86 family)
MTSPGHELQEKLANLSSYAQELESWLANPPDPARPGALQRIVERMIQVIVECAADAGDLWLAAQGHTLGGSVREVFQRLRDAGALTPEVAQRFFDYARTRNRIVHDYNHLDAVEVLHQAARLPADARAVVQSLMAE